MVTLPYTVTWQGQSTSTSGMIEQSIEVNEITIPNLNSDVYTVQVLDQSGVVLYSENIQISLSYELIRYEHCERMRIL